MPAGTGIQVQLVSPTDNQTPISPSGPLPAGAAPVVGSSGNVANASASATLAGGAAKTTYLTGLILSGLGATAAQASNLTITGALGGTITIPIGIPAGVGVPFFYQVSFPTPVPASAVNMALVCALAAAGAGNTNASVTAVGYQV